MRARLGFILIASLAGSFGCGASCKKSAEIVPLEEGTVIELPGVDNSALVLTEKRTFSKVVHDMMSPCGDPVTLEVCVREARPCKRCLPAAKYVTKLVAKGFDDKAIRDWIENRFDDRSVKSIDITGSPSLGPSNAPLVIVEFADFECPHCGAAAPVIHNVIDEPEFKGKVRFIFKNYPLTGHTHAESCARAATAAQNQGKFWEMHDQLFTHQDNLNDTEVEGYARKIGLDFDKWKADWASADVKERVNHDKDAGAKTGISGTPSFFVNGRKFQQVPPGDFADQIKEWMRLEPTLERSVPPGGGTPTPTPALAPSGSSSVAPAGSVPTAPASAPAAPRPSASGKPAASTKGL